MIPRRSHQVTPATMNRWTKISRMPSSPSGARASASSSVTIGPTYQKMFVSPIILPRAFWGENSAMSDQLVGTSAPTASPITMKPANSIGVFIAKTTISAPAM